MNTSKLLTAVTLQLTMALSASAVCIMPNSAGTVDLPPTAANCEYIPPPGGLMQILPPAIPAGSTIDIDPILFGPPFAISEVPGGALGGHTQTYNAILQMDITGTGALSGFLRTIFMQVAMVTESGPRSPGDAVQSFPVRIDSMTDSIFGDPDFDSISITAGNSQGLPSPGVTTLTRLGAAGSPFQVQSFFDTTYIIDFTGAPGSVLEGLGGPTTGQVRLQIGPTIPEPATAMLLGLGLLGLGCRQRHHQLA